MPNILPPSIFDHAVGQAIRAPSNTRSGTSHRNRTAHRVAGNPYFDASADGASATGSPNSHRLLQRGA
jgi:hypothetical protein